MALSEVLLQVQLDSVPLSRVAGPGSGVRVIYQPVAYDEDRFPTRSVITIAGPRARYEALLPGLQQYYDEFRVVRREEDVLTAVVAFNGRLEEVKRPFRDMLRLWGPDTWMRPIVFKDGWLTVGVITAADVDPAAVVRDLSAQMRRMGAQVRLLRVGEYRPERQPLGDYDEKLTPKQAEILKMALALGLYDSPRRCTLDDLSALFGISKAAAHNRLKSAEKKVLSLYFNE